MFLSLGAATYLGGLPGNGKSAKGQFLVSDDMIGIGSFAPNSPGVDVAAVESLEIESSQVAASRVGATLAFGVVGALAAKRSKDRAAIVVHLKSGDAAYFQIDGINSFEIRAKLGRWMVEHGIGLTP